MPKDRLNLETGEEYGHERTQDPGAPAAGKPCKACRAAEERAAKAERERRRLLEALRGFSDDFCQSICWDGCRHGRAAEAIAFAEADGGQPEGSPEQSEPSTEGGASETVNLRNSPPVRR